MRPALLLALAACGGASRDPEPTPPRPTGLLIVSDDPRAAEILAEGTWTRELTREEIESVIKASKEQLIACYRARLPDVPDLAGKIVVDFAIRSGAVTSASLGEGSNLRDPPLETCVLDVVRAMRFAPGFATVRYPFLFDPPRPSS
jgi:hypothetical protein